MEHHMISLRLLVFTLLLCLCAGTLQAIAWEVNEADGSTTTCASSEQ
ncbi:hypothetical protein amb1424 [Paramagnetospirillum magneticum AMB-1]|uniref:Uncharacterized protein n=1 Tax=Paramagnetospirillum magneticum (strain ATCC 700264 / AMB-1) TaxID=342108 RepID=Q2W7E7_PARM1|nr:hypothetical protein amb1424 [Paramagnetospirillum magneticum AMB-1]